MTRYAAIWLTSALLAGCQSCPPTKIPEPIAVPAACLAECSYNGPTAIKTNGDLLEGFQAQREQIGCYVARLDCIRSLR